MAKSHRTIRKAVLVLIAALSPGAAACQEIYTVDNEAALRNAITTAVAGDRIVLATNITLTADLPSIATDITIDGGGHTLSGNGQHRGLLVANFGGGSSSFPIAVAVTIQNLTIADTLAAGGKGGSGSAGGGGGAGMGGGLFVAQSASVTLRDVNFSGNRAIGGSGGTAVPAPPAPVSGGGGGGMGGNGGDGGAGFGGGGGGVGSTAAGGSGGAGSAGILTGGIAGGDSSAPGGANGGGGASSGQGAGGGGNAGSSGVSGTAGNGGYGGGGGGGAPLGPDGAFGGFGGGGGGGDCCGFGGYGGGGGGNDITATTNFGGFGGGDGGGPSAPGGGGGAGMGGGIFVDSGGTIVLSGSVTVNGNSVTGGEGSGGGQSGFAYGGGIFFAGSGAVQFDSAAGQTQTINDIIGDEFGSTGIIDTSSTTLFKSGAGTLILNAENQYAGNTIIAGGTLQAASAASLGSGNTIAIGDTATLAIAGTSTITQNLVLFGAAGLNAAAGQTATFSNTIEDDPMFPGGSLNVGGGGTVRLTNAANTYAGGTSVSGNSTLVIADDGALGAAAGGVTLGNAASAGTLSVEASVLGTNRAFTIAAGGGAIETATSFDIAGVTSGSGTMTKLGAGTLTLSGSSTRTGSTVVADGILRALTAGAFGTGGVQIGATGTLDLDAFDQSIGSLSGAGQVTLGTATLDVGSDNSSTTYAGAISGSGALVKTGTGGLTLTGTNSYSGGTTVSGGTLTGTTVSLQGDILNNAAVTFDQNGSGTYAGDMIGTGSLTKSGTGVLTLTGANTYSGGTTVSGGALSGTTATVQGNITNDAVVEFNQAANGTYAGTMTGTGTLVKSGTGTVTLTGANTYTGGTSIAGGTLAGDSTSVQGDIINNGNLVFNQTSNGTYAGTMVGTGTLTKAGTGTLTLTGQAAYTGGTTISGGLLAGNTQNLQGNIQNDAALQFNQNFAGLFTGSISGSGTVRKTGSGTLVLNGTNSYTGGTFLDGGTLIGTTLSLQGTIVNNAEAVFNQATNGTYAGLMSGSGSLVKAGAGTVTLSGNNSYSGGTSILGGSVVIAADAALGAANGGVVMGDAASSGTLSFTNASLLSSLRGFSLGASGGVFDTTGAPVTLFGNIGGTGGLSKTGIGTLELAGNNSYAGATTILGGTLRAGSNSGFGAGNALLVDGGATADLNGFSQSVSSLAGSGSILLGSGTLTAGAGGASGLFSGAISGSGSLVKDGSGTLVLSGANSYSGGTSVLGGTLLGNTTSMQGNIFNNGLVQFDQNNDGTYGGSMSGSGALAKTGEGVLTLTGTNTYSGGTFINGGSVIGSATSLSGLIVNNTRLTFGGATDGVFAGTVAGIGSLVKTGSGTLTLTGAQPVSGLFTVSQGTLALNGFYGGSIDVSAGASLRATGTIAGSLNLAGSLFAFSPESFTPLKGIQTFGGNTLEGPSHLTIGQNLTAIDGSLLDFTIGPGTTPTIFVGGTAAINGARFNVSAPSIGDLRSTSFLALATLNGLSLQNSSVTTVDTGVFPLLKQDRNSLFVTLVNLNPPLRPIASPGFTPVADALDRAKFPLPDGDGMFVITELTALDDAALRDALEQISGQLHASVLHTAILDTESVTDLIRDQLSARETDGVEDVRWWGEMACQRADFLANARSRGGRANVCAGAGGVDRRLSERLTVGGGGSYSDGRMGLGSMGSGDYSAPRAFGYVGFKPRRFGVRGGGSAAKSNYRTQRRIQFSALLPIELGGQPLSGGVDREAQAEQEGATSDSWGEFHDSYKFGSYTLEGLVGVRHARVSRGGFTESGAIALNLDAEDETLKLSQTDVKIRGFRREGTWRPFFDFNYRRELAEDSTEAEMRFSGLPQSEFIIQGLNIPASTYSTRLGLTLATVFGQATVTYEYKRALDQRRQTVGLRFRFK